MKSGANPFRFLKLSLKTALTSSNKFYLTRFLIHHFGLGFSTLGLSVSHPFELSKINFALHGLIAGRYAFLDRDFKSSYAFYREKDNILQSAGTTIDQFSWLFEAGIKTSINSSTQLWLNYKGELAPQTSKNNFTINLNINF